jgi:hypothetical protein
MAAMPAPAGKLTDFPEVVAYGLAHAAGIAWGFFVSPLIIRSLIAQGYREHIVLALIAHTLAVSIVVLLLFLLLRQAIGGSGAPPPPANAPAPPVKFTDGPELGAYVLAHAAGIAWNTLVTPLIFRQLIAQGLQHVLMPIGLGLSITVSIVVLLIFLFLRKVMSGPA